MLQDNARVSNSDIAKKTNMAPSGTIERVRRLTRMGIIRGYRALFDERKLGLNFLAYTDVLVQKNCTDAVSAAILKIPYVIELHEVAGNASYHLKIRARDREHFSDILHNFINPIPGILETKSAIVLRSLKEDPSIPLADVVTVVSD